LGCSGKLLAEDHVGGLFGDHDGRGVGVAADQGRHDRGVDHAQSLDAAHLELGVDHGVWVGAHAAGADRVVDGLGLGADEVDQAVAARPHRCRGSISWARKGEGRLVEDLARQRTHSSIISRSSASLR
jgi:hypothetical protein